MSVHEVHTVIQAPTQLFQTHSDYAIHHLKFQLLSKMRPDLLLISDCSEVASGSGHGLATDIFSLGSVLYTMLVGGPPFESSDLLETINRIKAVLYKMPNLLSAKAQHLIMSVMRLSPDDRLTLNGLCCFSLFCITVTYLLLISYCYHFQSSFSRLTFLELIKVMLGAQGRTY